MTVPSNWQIGNCLEWYIQLPVYNRPRESPVFLIQNTECYFELRRGTDNLYHLYMKPKMTGTKLEPVPIIIYSDHYGTTGTGNFSRYCGADYYDLDKSRILYFSEASFKNRGQNLSTGHFITFCFVFKNEDGPSLLFRKKNDEKSTQADLMLSLQTDVEYLSLDFGELLRNGDHSDVQLLCNGGNIPAHRAVLAARSKTFLDLFRDNTEASKNGLMNFTTTEKSVMELCLEFIYKGKILNLPAEKASNLYVLGHGLKISSLTKVCADLMVHNLCEDNYISYLLLVDKYNDDHFKSGIIDFISDHLQFLKSENWVKFSDEHVKTASDVHRKCLLKFI